MQGALHGAEFYHNGREEHFYDFPYKDIIGRQNYLGIRGKSYFSLYKTVPLNMRSLLSPL